MLIEANTARSEERILAQASRRVDTLLVIPAVTSGVKTFMAQGGG